MYGLRKQADLCKLARKYGVEDLLPWSRKKLAVKRARKEQLGVRVKGTGVGQRVKGHIQERSMQSKMDARRDAMLKMPEMIREWKIVSILLDCSLNDTNECHREDMAKGGRNGPNNDITDKIILYHIPYALSRYPAFRPLWLIVYSTPELRATNLL